MAKTPTNFKTATQLGTTATELTSVASSSAAVNLIRAVSFFNQSTTDLQTVSVYRYEIGGTASDSNLVIQKSIPPRKTWSAFELQGKVIAAGFLLAATATTTSTVNAECDGVISS